MLGEAKPFIEKYSLEPDNEALKGAPCHVFRGKTPGGTPLTVVCNGTDAATGVDMTAKVPAAIATLLCIRELKPAVLINVGTAGGWKSQGGEIGKIYIPDTIQNHDRRIPINDAWQTYAIGTVKPTAGGNLRKAMGWEGGLCTTGESLDHTEQDMKLMTDGPNGHVVCKEMEAAAIGWTCTQFKQPFFMIKGIPNLKDGPLQPADEFSANLEKVAAALSDALDKTLAFVDENGLQALLSCAGTE